MKGGSWRHQPNTTSTLVFSSGKAIGLKVNTNYAFSITCCELSSPCDTPNAGMLTFSSTLGSFSSVFIFVVTPPQIPPLTVSHLNPTSIALSWFGASVYRGFPTEVFLLLFYLSQFYVVSWSTTPSFDEQASVRIDIPAERRSNTPPLNATFQSLTISDLITGSTYYFRVTAGNNFSVVVSDTLSSLIGSLIVISHASK